MSLQISNQNGIFHLNGKINTTTLSFFETYFTHNLSQLKKIVINIDDLIEIDSSGVKAIKNFMKATILEQKLFSIIGKGCKEIYDDFNQTNVA